MIFGKTPVILVWFGVLKYVLKVNFVKNKSQCTLITKLMPLIYNILWNQTALHFSNISSLNINKCTPKLNFLQKIVFIYQPSIQCQIPGINKV